jgi:hypothetical protein
VALATQDWHGVAVCEAEINVRPRARGRFDYAQIVVQPAIPGQSSMDFATGFVQNHPLEAGEEAVSAFAPVPAFPEAVERTLVRQLLDEVKLLQRLWVVGAQRVAVTATVNLRGMVDGLEIAVGQLATDAAKLDATRYFSPSVSFGVDSDWRVEERLTLRRQDTNERIVVDHELLDDDLAPDAWFKGKVDGYLSRMAGNDPRLALRGKGQLFGTLSGDLVTIRTRHAQPNGSIRNVVTKLGFASQGLDAYLITISLGDDQQARFPGLASHAHLMA